MPDNRGFIKMLVGHLVVLLDTDAVLVSQAKVMMSCDHPTPNAFRQNAVEADAMSDTTTRDAPVSATR